MDLDLRSLFQRVFGLQRAERIVIMHDVPNTNDTSNWLWRRKIAREWHHELNDLGFKSELVHYNATYSSNADLPFCVYVNEKEKDLKKIVSNTDIIVSLTEFSATAPLKKLAKKFGVRVASMPGFNNKMMDALNLDFDNVSEKVGKINNMIRKSSGAQITFTVQGKNYPLYLDLSKNKTLADNGNCKKKGTVINLPSGEAFITPNEGKGSKSTGFLPIQHNGSVSVYKVSENNIIDCLSKNDMLMRKIALDPAVGNIAEMAFGVLSDYGIKACGRTLLDEKLGFHIALGRSDHFGGTTSTKSFRNKQNVWHKDFVYIKETQPNIDLKQVNLTNNNTQQLIIKNNAYAVV